MLNKIVCSLILFLAVSCNNSSGINQASGLAPDHPASLGALNKVSMHPDNMLRRNTSCELTMSIHLIQSKNYAETVLELKNRALVLGGNAVSLSKWKETTQTTYLNGRVYLCLKKPFHIHPHPTGF